MSQRKTWDEVKIEEAERKFTKCNKKKLKTFSAMDKVICFQNAQHFEHYAKILIFARLYVQLEKVTNPDDKTDGKEKRTYLNQ